MVPPATSIGRPEGISAMVCTYNEEDWVEPSLLSIKDAVDEYVVIDSSSDQTANKISELKKAHGLNMIMKQTEPGNLVFARNLALKHSSYRWILHWDADFVAMDRTPRYLKDLIEILDPKRYHLTYYQLSCLDGDLFHQDPNNRFNIEHWLFTYSPTLKYMFIDNFDHLIAPVTYYTARLLNEVLALHLRTVKSPRRILYKSLWYRMRNEGLEGKIYLDEYVQSKVKELYGTFDVERAAEINLGEYLGNLVAVDKSSFMYYPEILKDYAKAKYGILL